MVEFAYLLKNSISGVLNGKKIEMRSVYLSVLEEDRYLHDLTKQSLAARFPEFVGLLVFPEDSSQSVPQALGALEFLQRYSMERLDSDLRDLIGRRD